MEKKALKIFKPSWSFPRSRRHRCSAVIHPLDEPEFKMALPPELVEEILIYLRHDKRTLLNCSLVAKSWIYTSQKLYYWDQCFTPETYRTWQETASPTSTELLQHVRLLTCSLFTSLDDFHRDHLKLFHRLQHLTLTRIGSIRPDVIDLLSASLNTLSLLHLCYVSVYDSILAKFIDCFPNIRELHIDQATIEEDDSTSPSASRPPRGKLRLNCLRARDMAVLSSCLSKLELEYDELEVASSLNRPYLYLPPIVYGCGKTLARLELEPLESKFPCYEPPILRAASNIRPWYSSTFQSHSRELLRITRTRVPHLPKGPTSGGTLSRRIHYFHEHAEDPVCAVLQGRWMEPR